MSIHTFWDRITSTVMAEFADLQDVEGGTRIVVRLTMAALLSGAIGWERERHDAAAGLRTHMPVGLGSAMFVLAPPARSCANARPSASVD